MIAPYADAARRATRRGALFCALAAGMLATPPAPAGEPGDRPRVGLVLAGGGAQGGAHAGVIEVLEELNVPVDCIAGTSVGAVIGGGYASGIPAAELRRFVLGIDWQAVVGGLGRRDLQPIAEKRGGVSYSNDFEFGLRARRLVLPGGAVSAASIEDLLRSYVASSRAQTDFSGLPIPFRAVATDLVSGNMVVLGSGDLATAMRASMAIPGAFAPVSMGDYVLADGGMVRNIPVDVARELCAEVVIVVNLVRPPVTREQLQSGVRVIHRGMDVMIQANEEAQLRTLTERDVLIEVPMGDITVADFDRVPETVELGARAARAAAGRLAALAVPPGEYRAWRERITTPPALEARLGEVRYEGLERVNPAYLERRARVRAGDLVDKVAISREAQRMSALQDFESVEYELEGNPDEPTLVWLPREKPWGPHYLRFDFGLYASEGGDLAFMVNAKHHRSWLNPLGGEWRNELQLGYENLLATSFYQPLDLAQRLFVEPRLFVDRNWEDFFVDGDRVATYRFSQWGGNLDLGVNLATLAQARVGYVYARRHVSVDTGAPLLPRGDVDDSGLGFEAIYDSRDTPYNPTRGSAAALEYRRSDSDLGADRDWETVEFGLGTAIPVRDHLLWLALAGGSDLGSALPLDRAFAIGGPGSFPGYELGELRTDSYWLASASYLRKLRDILWVRGQALYGGLRLHAGRVHDAYGMFDDERIYGASLYLTGRTPVGPLTLGIATTNTDSWSMWLAVGRPIGHGSILERGVFR
jgi:NTE family protein